MDDGGSTDAKGRVWVQPPSTTPPPSVRAAILARVVQQTIGGRETPLLDGRYRLLQEIGRGGAGTVWKAELLPLGRQVAVKLLRPGVASSGNAVSRLMREAMSVSKLGHEHIVQVNDVGTDEHGSPYIAMELLEGESLAQLVRRRGRLPWREVAEIATQLCDALAAAHAVGIVHRDVKPANVIAMRRGDGRWRCKLLDFGLCTAGRDTPVLTAAGVLLGTPGYAAVEQLRGEAVDGRADLYGLACVMVELLTGHPAFQGVSRQDVVDNQLAGRRSGALDALDLPDEVVALVDRGLCGDANDRHDDPVAFAEAIADVRRTEGAPVRGAGSTARSTVGWRGRVGGVLAVACAAGVAIVAWSSGPDASRSTPISPMLAGIPRARPPSPPVVPAPQETEDVATAEPDVRKRPDTSAPSPPRPARRKRVRRPPSPPQPPAEEAPDTPDPPVKRTYPDGIRDPFAIR